MANELAIAMRDAGTELAETFSNRGSSGSRTRYGTVKANNGQTLDVELAGGSVSGVPMTTACVGAKAGDRVLLTVDGPLVTATGILATGDNGPYVDLPWTPLLGSLGNGAAYAAASGVASVSVVNVTVGAGQTRRLGTLPAEIRPKAQALAVVGGSSPGGAVGWLWVSTSGEVSVCATSQADVQGALTYVIGG